MDKRTSRAFRPSCPSPLEERLAPGNFLSDLGEGFTSLGRRIADPYVRLGNRIAGVDTTPPRNPTFTTTQIRRWTVIARVVSGEMSAPPPPSSPFAPPPPPPMMPDAS
ncbi:hypothetical protein TA3x_005258 [Tundrisphaera sp. TA3]|uniref:hypothetical protein n=1 Tax=Tundrisphaera sp. TA3 TaxID=3435775 RepID=UPI003EB73D9B